MQGDREAKRVHRGEKSTPRKKKRAMSAILYSAAKANAVMKTPKVNEIVQTTAEPTTPTTTSPTPAGTRQLDQQPAKPASPKRCRNHRSAKKPTMTTAQPQPRRPYYPAEEPLSIPPPKAPNTGGPSTGRSDRKANLLRRTMQGAAPLDLIDEAIKKDRRLQTERRMANHGRSDERRKAEVDPRGTGVTQERVAMT